MSGTGADRPARLKERQPTSRLTAILCVGGHFDMPTYPLAMAVRDELGARFIDPLYRSAICFDTTSKEFFIGK